MTTSSVASTVSSTGTVSSLGTGSGLDLQTLLTNLVSNAKAPQQALITNSQTTVNAQISALGTVQGQVAAFQTALNAITGSSAFNTKTATSGDSTAFTATATDNADNANYTVGVVSLASANKLASNNFASSAAVVGTGTLAIGVGNATFNVTIDSSNNTVSGVVDAINAASGNAGVKASLLTVSNGTGGTATKIVLTSTSSGAANQLSIGVTDSDGNNTDASGLSALSYNIANTSTTSPNQLSLVDPAQDAQITVDGFPATSSTNTFANTIKGVTITAVKASATTTPPTTNSLGIATDTTTVQTNIDAFVTSYNALITSLNTNASYNSATSTAGPLYGDSAVSLIQRQITQSISGDITGGTGGISNLAQLGITTNADGTLTVNDDTLTSVLKSNYSDVANLFSGTNGIGTQLNSFVTSYLSSNGAFASDQATMQAQLTDLTNQQTNLDDKMTSLQNLYQAQFANLDSIVATLNSTSSYLTQQFDAMNKTSSTS